MVFAVAYTFMLVYQIGMWLVVHTCSLVLVGSVGCFPTLCNYTIVEPLCKTDSEGGGLSLPRRHCAPARLNTL